MNTQSCFNATPWVIKAGPILLAGLTLVPVNGIPNKWTSTSVRPIASPAWYGSPNTELKSLAQATNPDAV